jgi:8-oxo-dGTP pyrophosphatase MutT (NUDIX family)
MIPNRGNRFSDEIMLNHGKSVRRGFLMRKIAQRDAFHQTGWPGLRARLFHLYFLLARPMTLGVRGIVHDRATNSVFLIRHTYVPGWQFPGGGVERGETTVEALERELQEEGNITVTGPMALKSLHFNRQASNRDHVAVYLVEAFEQTAPKLSDREIAEAGFFPLDRLPDQTTPATLRRITEIFSDAPASVYW